MPTHMDWLPANTKRGLSALADLIWPRRSILSGVIGQGGVTPSEFSRLTFLTGTLCQRCGGPQEIDLGADTVCAACTARPPRWARARAALVYDQEIRAAIMGLKRAGRRDGLTVLANWMMLAGRDVVEEADLLIPVPLHYRRLVRRGFNQAVWLAAALSRQSGVPWITSALRRIRATPSQGELTARQRHRNVAGAFRVRPKVQPKIAGRRVVLIDDVLTTGATATACTRALYSAGVANVDVLVLARVVVAEDVTIY